MCMLYLGRRGGGGARLHRQLDVIQLQVGTQALREKRKAREAVSRLTNCPQTLSRTHGGRNTKNVQKALPLHFASTRGGLT
jgi:hypothetical protein